MEQALQEKEAFDEKLRQDMQLEKEKVQRKMFCDVSECVHIVIFSLREIGESIRRPVPRLMKLVRGCRML